MSAGTQGPPPADLLDSPSAGGVAIRGSLMRGAGYGVTVLLGLASAPLLTRHLGLVDFGRYAQVAALIAVVGTVTDAGLNTLAVRELAVLDADAGRALMRNLLGMRLVLTAIGTLLAVGFAVVAGYGSELVAGTFVAGAGLLVYVTQAAYAAPLFATLRLGWVTLADVLRQGTLTVCVVLAVLAGAGVVTFLALPIVAGCAALALTAVLVRHEVPWRPGFDAAAWRRILLETFPLAASGAIYGIYFRAVMLLMSIMVTAEQVGYYALSFRIVEVLVTLPFVVVGSTGAIFARAAADDRDRFHFALQRTFDVAVAMGCGVALLTVLGAPVAIALLSDEPASTAVDVLRIQGAGLLATFVAVTFGLAFVSLRRHRDLMLANGVALSATVVATLVLAPSHGAVGGAIAATGGEVVLVAAYAVLLLRRRPDLALSLGALPRAVGAAAAALVTARIVAVPIVPNAADVVVGGLVYAVVLGAVGGIPREIVDALRHRSPAAVPE